jgi:hypothetical protein
VLRTGSPGSIREAVLLAGGPLFQEPCAKLLQCVRAGRPAFDAIHGRSFFEYLEADPEAHRLFQVGMASHSDAENQFLVEGYDFSSFHVLADIGGGHGGLIAAVLQACPNARGILFDQIVGPETAIRLAQAGVADRCAVVAGDFFQGVPPGCDAYLLKRVLHDWDDAACRTILRRCREAMLPNGRILVIDTLVPTGNEPHPSKFGDLVMMVLLRGRERTVEEFQRLYREAGLQLTRCVPTRYSHWLIEGQRA